ncbi:hypothetical protein [Methylobacterium sp. 77]|uniref:hypothetical protein n=1 Tax=Methylobacterium sp. 77 TaxID=1101192 RepID=UPI0012DEC7AC|nr:hypothetical protein [Methylobacterium sp. 77]
MLDRHADLVHVGSRDLWIRPVRHVALRVMIDGTSNPDAFYLKWSMLDLFTPLDGLFGSIGWCSGKLGRTGASPYAVWRWSDPSTVGDAISAIETEALPLLRSADRLETFAAFYRENFEIARIGAPEDRLIIDIALGHLEGAQRIVRDLLPRFKEASPSSASYQATRTKILAVADPLLAGDRPALAAILHGWEAGNIRGTKIEPYWEPTPFPLERAPG